MPENYYFGYYFYAPNGRFEPCGMFTFAHIISALICIIAVAILLILTKNKFVGVQKTKLLRISAIVLTITEIIKIAHSFLYGDLHLDAWFPLSYCGLFIFALWMSGYGKNRIQHIGEAFIAFGCPFAGIAFLVFPTTSLMSYPIWHYFSLYSMLYHSLMIFIGISLLRNEPMLTSEKYKNYCIFVFPFSAIAITLNLIFGSNLMNLREPYNIPIQLLQDIYSEMPWIYTVLVLLIYLAIPFVSRCFAFLQRNSKK